jgi:DNA-binding response OmpR family regulator
MAEKQCVLVVDDEVKLLELVKSYLEANGFSALTAKTGTAGMAFFEAAAPPVSLVLLDLMLPDMAGEVFCKRVRRVSNIPVIMLTACADEESIIRGLSLGADDYVTKPFSPRQLMARVKAALRRSGQSGDSRTDNRTLSAGDIVLNTETRRASRNGETLPLTRDEFLILELFLSRPHKVFTRDEILDAVKGGDYDGFDRSIDSHIKRLRAKIGDDSKSPKYIETVYGVGYRLGGGIE